MLCGTGLSWCPPSERAMVERERVPGELPVLATHLVDEGLPAGRSAPRDVGLSLNVMYVTELGRARPYGDYDRRKAWGHGHETAPQIRHRAGHCSRRHTAHRASGCR